LGFDGALSSLKRLSEGDFVYDNEVPLNPLDYLSFEENRYLGDMSDIELGKKLNIQMFENKKNGIYKFVDERYLALIEIKDDEVNYVLNKVKLC